MLLTMLGGFIVVGLARSPDSGLTVGLFVAAPSFAVAAALATLAYWSRDERDERAATTDLRFVGAGLLGLVGLVLVMGLFGAGPFGGLASLAVGLGCAVAAVVLGLTARPFKAGHQVHVRRRTLMASPSSPPDSGPVQARPHG